MARYDNDVIEWWNDAYQGLVKTSDYRDLCSDAQGRHSTICNIHMFGRKCL